MPEPNPDDWRLVLDLCASKGLDGLLYPRVDVVNLDRVRLDAALDHLRLGGFVEIGDWTPQKGQGYRLTPAGGEALDRPALLHRPAPRRDDVIFIRSEQWDQAKAIQEAVLSPPNAIVTRILVGINVSIYVATLVYVMYLGVSFNDALNGRYFFPVPGHQDFVAIVMVPGALSPAEFFAGHWWQLATYMFMHGNLVHIAANMFCLVLLGNKLEGLWGWKRFAFLYLASGLIAGVAIALFSYAPTVGASGAIAGLFASLAVWVAMHREYLPRRFVEANYRVVGIILAIMVASGYYETNVSMAGHVGGAAGGALLAIPLSWLGPFSSRRHRIIGIVTLILIAAVCVLVLHMSPRNGAFGH